MRLSRKLGLLGGQTKPPTLAELFADATFVARIARNMSSQGTISTSVPGLTEGTTLYGFFWAGDSYEIFKAVITNNRPVMTTLKTNASYGSHIIVSMYNTYDTVSRFYGGILFFLQFPSYDPAVVDTILSSMTVTVKAQRQSNTTGTINTLTSNIVADNDHLYVAALPYSPGYMSFSAGANMTSPIWSYPGSIAYLRLYNNRYYLSHDGVSNTSMYAGGIYELSDS